MSRIAVVGSGISGMTAAYLLSRKHEVVLLEKETRLGGHTHTHIVDSSRGPLAVDTGFIVHNDRTYPNFTRLMEELGVERQPSDMSFGVTDRATGLEYSSRGLNGLFATRGTIFSPRHYKLLREILRFNKIAVQFSDNPASGPITLREYLQTHCFSQRFADLYIYPMAAAVWSTSLQEIGSFPALALIRFFQNHGFFGYFGQPTWYTLKGGSSRYIEPLTRPYKSQIRLGIQIAGIRRTPIGVQIVCKDSSAETFDEVVFACHAPQALALLEDASSIETDVLKTFQTTRNSVVLHTDSRLLPRRKAARASWNYLRDSSASSGPGAVTVTYDMNRLQRLQTAETYCVTLNANEAIHPQRILRKLEYAHPLYTLDAIRSQGRWAEISGSSHTHFCGAYWFNGFHEDGVNSAMRVARILGVEW